MKLMYVAFACLLSGCQETTAVGLVLDGMTEQPMAGLRVLAKATGPTDLSCQVLETSSDDQGQFLFNNPCPDTSYALVSGDKTVFLAGSPTFTGGVPTEAQLTLRAWRSPPGNGVYVLKGTEIFTMRTASRVSELPLWKSRDETVLYPDTIPSKLPSIGEQDYLILSGVKAIKRLEILPLIRHEKKLRFGSRNHKIDMDPWSYIGRHFTSKEKHEAVATQLDDSQVLKVIEEKRALMYIPGTALPSGIYALIGPGDKRVYLFEIKG